MRERTGVRVSGPRWGRGPRRGSDVSQGSILIVEDEQGLRELLTEVLEVAGFSVTAVRLAEDVPELLGVSVPDLIVLDLVMPSGTMQGMDLLSTLREVEEWKDLPVVIVSGLGNLVNRDV